MNGMPPNLHGYIIETSLRADQILVTWTSFLRSEGIGVKILVPTISLEQVNRILSNSHGYIIGIS